MTWTMSPDSRGVAGRPVQHRAAGEVPAAADQREAVAEVERPAAPEAQGGVLAHRPAPRRLVQVHRAVEAVRPLHHRRVVVRVRDRDRGEPAAALDLGGRVVVEQRHAVPQQVAVAERHEQRALADRELRLGADAGQLALAGGSRCVCSRRSSSSVVQRWPAVGDVLALVLADRAVVGRRVGVRVLDPAGDADVMHAAGRYRDRGFAPLGPALRPPGVRRPGLARGSYTVSVLPTRRASTAIGRAVAWPK